MIPRTKYLDAVLPFIDQPLMKVIIGVRRSGKTVLLSQIRELIAGRGVAPEQIVAVNFESFANRQYLQPEALYEMVAARSRAAAKKCYLFFDEIQEVAQWEKVVNSFSVDFDCDIYLTGSNSNLLSGELATYISGRYVHIPVYPFTFAESRAYSRQLGENKSDDALFREYLQFGGLPQRFTLGTDQAKRAYLEDVFNTIVIKDIVARNKVTDVDLLQRLVSFLLDNIGNPFSANAICNKLRAEGVRTSVPTVSSYLTYIRNAMVVQTARRYDIKGKALLSSNEKYFATDLGLRNLVKSTSILDYSKLFENVVFLEMVARGYEVNVGKLDDYEVDFICCKEKQKIYLQVAYLLADESVVEREFRPLRGIADNFPKYVISGDRLDFSGDGIVHRNIIEFLLDSSL